MDARRLRDEAHTALGQGEVNLARSRFRAAIALGAGDAPLLRELGGSLWALYDFDHALEAYRRAADSGAEVVESCLLAAQKLFSLARFGECAAWLERALERSPANVRLLTMLGEVYDRHNRVGEAVNCAARALERDPSDVQAVRLMAHLERRQDQLDQARQRLAHHLRRYPSAEDWRLRYELAAVLDRLGDYDAAITQLFAAKAQLEPLARPHLAIARLIRQRQQDLARLLTAADWTAWRAVRARLQAPARIAFLCGHPRSGTTLLERVLAAHPEVITTDETGILTREFIEPLVRRPASAESAVEELRAFTLEQLGDGRAAYFQFTSAHLGAAVAGRLLIEKDPNLTPDLPVALRLFPEARVLFPLRDPRDVCVSYFFTLLPLNHVSVDALDLGSTCANCAHSLAAWHHWRAVLPYPWRETRYEDLVSHPETELGRLQQFLGVTPEPRLVDFHREQPAKGVRTPSYADVTRPFYQRSIGRWKHYEKHLAPHLEALRPWLRVFGYES